MNNQFTTYWQNVTAALIEYRPASVSNLSILAYAWLRPRPLAQTANASYVWFGVALTTSTEATQLGFQDLRHQISHGP